MGEEKDMAFISIAFTAGIAAAGMLGIPFVCSLVSSVLSALLICLCIVSKERCRLQTGVLFFVLGAMCLATDSLSAGFFRTEGLHSGIAGDGAMAKLCGLISRCGFRRELTEGLVTALLTGRKDGLSYQTILYFRKSGASHILALSGLHLGIIYAILSKVLSPLGNSTAAKTIKGLTVISFCAFYTVMTGGSASTRRAFLFIAINELTRSQSGRTHNPKCTFCLALTVQLALNPSDIANVGFQLSYLAMLGILTVFPKLESWYPVTGRRMRDKFDIPRRIWSSMALSISCQMLTAPVAWWHFHTFPANFLLTNLIALPLTEILITTAVATIALTALGICPGMLTTLTDRTAGLLDFSLKAIASM